MVDFSLVTIVLSWPGIAIWTFSLETVHAVYFFLSKVRKLKICRLDYEKKKNMWNARLEEEEHDEASLIM